MAGITELICAFTSICEEDHCWIDQYLMESERLGIKFAMHFDRCSDGTKHKILSHRNCIDHTYQDNKSIEFNERHKQRIFHKIYENQYRGGFYTWAMAWDIDETYEQCALQKIMVLENQTLRTDHAQVKWVNLWGDSSTIRTDRHYSSGHRVKFYNLSSGNWIFDHPITNGCKLVGRRARPLLKMDLTCIHWGMMTLELRELHKERWDRIYTTAVGDNPYGFWKDAIDESIEPILEKHNYF